MEDYLGKKTFLVAGFIILGVKKWTFFRLISIEKVKNYLLIQKDNSLTFFMRQKKGTFFQNCHFLITGRVVLHKKFYKKFHLPVIKNGRLFRQKNFFWWLDLLFSGWKNEHFFDWFQSKVKNYLLIQKIILWHFLCDKRRERFFQNLSLFDNWSCSTTQEIL